MRSLTRSDAHQAACWRYDGPWDIYNLSATDDLPTAAAGYSAVVDSATDRIVGFFCIGPEARVPGLDEDPGVLDLGVGLDPKWVGKGHGMAFGAAVLDHLRRDHPSTPVRAAIQAWNLRSRQLVRRLGFVEREQHRCIQNGRSVTYIVAVLSVPRE
ncbi:GNAT family N-acetyltransferase [Nocardia sp. NPDC046473]|uniref:GNAT family N-acetyltransferase n=1 Tax=Nocardia sp. NPDC046473 TaxID=3155733 RepID=UPI00340613E6